MATTKSHPMSLAMSPPGVYPSPLGDVTLGHFEAGKLVMPTGLLRGRDLFVAAGGFSVALARGTYPVTLVTAQLKDRRLPRAYSGRRIAYAVLSVSESKPVSWSLAEHDGQDEGYCVDSWDGCFMDDEARRDQQQ